jgi:hypothetical protein
MNALPLGTLLLTLANSSCLRLKQKRLEPGWTGLLLSMVDSVFRRVEPSRLGSTGGSTLYSLAPLVQVGRPVRSIGSELFT